MKNFAKSFLKYTITIALTAYLIWVAFDAIDDQHLAEGESKVDFIHKTWKESNKGFILLSGVACLLSILIRAERWRLALAPMGYKTSLANSFHAVLNSYFVNLALPRGGEISRPMTLRKLDKVPVDASIGTVVMERLIDMIFLLFLIGIVFVAQLDVFLGFFSDILHRNDAQHIDEGAKKGYLLYILVIVGVALIVFSIYFFIKKRFRFNRYVVLTKFFMLGLKRGLLSVFNLEKTGLFIFYSLLIWVMYYVMLYMVLLAFHETAHMGALDALTVFVVGGIAMSLPLPGGAGSYHLLVPLALTQLCGLPSFGKAVAFATIFHGWQTLVFIVAGGISLMMVQRILNKRKRLHALQK